MTSGFILSRPTSIYRTAPFLWFNILHQGCFLCLLALVLSMQTPLLAAARVFSILDYGAVGNGLTPCTASINQAVTACAEAGGGQVRFPPGQFLSGTIRLPSHITLFLEAGATLIGTTNLADYDHFRPPPGTPEARFRPQWHRALILASNAVQIAVLGPGTIDGNRVFDPKGEERMRGPHTILLGHCRDVVIRDITVRDSANYALMLEDCGDVEVRNAKMTGGWDGVHFRGWPDRPCRNVSIVGCQFYTGDDAIAGRYWENVLITDCVINSSCNGIRLIGPATQLIIRDCLFYGPGLHPHRTSNRFNMLAGINLQPGAWDATEGLLDEVLISDITMKKVTTPFHFALKRGNSAGRITVSDVTAVDVYRTAISVESWADTPFTNIVFRDLNIEFAGGGQPDGAGRKIKQPGVDARPLPVWGFYGRNIGTLTFEDVRFSCTAEDLRPVLLCDQIDELCLRNFQFPHVPAVTDPLLLTNVGCFLKEALFH